VLQAPGGAASTSYTLHRTPSRVKINPIMRKRLSDDALAYFRQQGAKGGKISRETSTPAQRSARATKASHAAAVARTKKRLAKAKG